jgi:L-threonylcarbamoyladenylate synthase
MIGNDITHAALLLKAGEVVAIPTETVYGLAANAFNGNAVASIYRIKNRPQFNPLIIHTNSTEKLTEWGLQLPQPMQELLKHFSPGPLTYLIPSTPHIPEIVTAGTQAVAVRIPNHPITLQLLSMLDFPLAAPSANPSGYISPTTAVHVQTQLGHAIPYILDGGTCEVGIESTIISFLDNKPEILRYGGISKEKIEQIIGPINDKAIHPSTIIPAEKPLAPGMLTKHYAPLKPIFVGNITQLLHDKDKKRVAVISFQSVYDNIPIENQFCLSVSGNLNEAAQNLFAAMRKAETLDIDCILAEIFPAKDIGRAINDRLMRASAKE